MILTLAEISGRTFIRGRGWNLDLCSVCGEHEHKHTWRCDGCGTDADLGRCRCGAVHLPEPRCDCNNGCTLHCPEPSN